MPDDRLSSTRSLWLGSRGIRRAAINVVLRGVRCIKRIVNTRRRSRLAISAIASKNHTGKRDLQAG